LTMNQNVSLAESCIHLGLGTVVGVPSGRAEF
jgi:hypothetical protein